MNRYHELSMSFEMLRDLYETWLILAIGMLVRWNRWSPLMHGIVSPLDPSLRHIVGDNERWAGVYFGCGTLMAIMQYRPLWVRRCRHRVCILMLMSEIMLLLQMVYWIDCQLWQSFLGLFEDLFFALGRGQWGSWFSFCPAAVRNLFLCGDVFDVFRLLASFSIFALALNSTAGEWRVSLDFLLIGYFPNTSLWRQSLYVGYRRKGFERRDYVLPTLPPPELPIYKRMCRLCLQQLEANPTHHEIQMPC
ncbi:GM22832 [Drosophila sechellia]|uniref:GM22832 n=2 Tax=Drosophila sechellia TaxID=7238 RepID=B4I6P5_DROSE|nr:GM22832 [Drosophila sechellia]